MRRFLVSLVSFACISLLNSTVFAQLTTTILNGETIKLRSVASIGTAINDLTHAGDGSGRLFVVTQNGSIRIIDNGSLLATPFMTSSNFTGFTSGGETGLLGLAFHPDYANVGQPGFGKFYTFSSQTKTGSADFYNNFGSETIGPTGGTFQNVLREWTVTNPAANVFSGTSRTLFTIARAQSNHNGGGLAFGPDKNLYIGLGDGGGSFDALGQNNNNDGHTNGIGNAQDLNVVYGKMLRINPLTGQAGTNPSANGQYGIPTSNPFVGVAGVDEIYAYGLRNPFRFSFDSADGKLIAGDVGQGQREEIDLILSGRNYGWGNREGTVVLNGAPLSGIVTDPIAEYTHSNGIAVIGGYVNRGNLLPASLVGDYIFGDLNGSLYYLDPNTATNPNGQIYRFGIDPTGASLSSINGFGRDELGNLYVLLGNGNVLQIIPEPSQIGLAVFGFAMIGWGWKGGRRLRR